MAEETSEPTKIIRKKTGNFLEDFKPGQVFRHKGGKTITEGLFTTFTEFAMTTHPFAKNARYSKAYGFEGMVCPPAWSCSSRSARPSRTSPRTPARTSSTSRLGNGTAPRPASRPRSVAARAVGAWPRL